MKLDERSSARLDALRFPLIVGVVFIHAYHAQIGMATGSVGVPESGFLSDFIRTLISQGVARIAVPLFFIMSGYFLFWGFSWSILNYKKKICSRIKSLLIPFLFWNCVTLAFIALAQSIPATQVFFSGRIPSLFSLDAYGYVNVIFGIEQLPIAYHFWFIRDLMVLCLFMPVIFFFIKFMPLVSVVFILPLWIFDFIPLSEQSSLSVTFFLLGACLGYSKIDLFLLDRYEAFIFPTYISLLIFDALTKGMWFNGPIHNISVIVGCLVVLCLSRFLISPTRVRGFFAWASGASFFIFAAHEPLLTVLRKVAFKTFAPSTDAAVLFLYFFVPTMVISFLGFVYFCMKRYAPKILAMISGGR